MRAGGGWGLLLPVAILIGMAAQSAAAAPACVPSIGVTHAKVVRVDKNGIVVLADGRSVRAEGVLLPSGAGDAAPQTFADQAITTLGNLTRDRSVSLAAEPPKEDRYGRLRAQIIVHVGGVDNWLQREILRKGLARVSIAPDRNECAEELYAIEAEARREKRGLWSSPAYAIRAASEAGDYTGTFQVVEGTVNSVSNRGGRVFLDFASGDGFAATISAEDMKRFRQIGVDPRTYAGEKMRMRGWIAHVRGRPEIALATPAQVEIVK